ncbi:signal peptidase I [Protaetiibacter mangrovi]|uniref:Signal peptidase I n=1 Tax=Protaetiibacter mangrovi TaxID=2970926 RepID=A0ABT1ZII4_9MICO|nr:signal peptidase I [Protaetiibacter mangrovi]MCS0500498.1 signal peptidase I [Protaetiibacter mangrovi]TPX05216.1 signal peptidase I [Schumannella luteola]
MSERRAARDAQKKDHGLLYYIGVGLSWGVLALVALIAALVVVVPAVAQATPYTILTSSMEPNYPPGTLVIVKPIATDDIRIGTVITYQLESGEPEVVTHRVVQIVQPNLPGGEKSFVTKGDANSQADPNPVKPVQIRGAVWYAVPWIGWVNNLVNGDMRSIIIPVVAGFLFLYGGWLIVSNRLEKRKKRRTEELAAQEAAGQEELARYAPPGPSA